MNKPLWLMHLATIREFCREFACPPVTKVPHRVATPDSLPNSTVCHRRLHHLCEPSDRVVTYNQMVVDDLTDEQVDRIFQALADATRRDIVARVAQREQSVSKLANQYSMSFAAVQKHVAALERALFVTKQRRGREQIVHANPEAINKAARLLDGYEALWRQRARAIDDILSNN